ncbi:MAG: glycosyltransferase [Verrucomicrobia bacterium]|nr:glycosyltransferase [Verrucomicrobiota bacterium]
MGNDVSVIFLDSAPIGANRRPVKLLDGVANLEWRTHYFATRASSAIRLAWDRMRRLCLQARFAATGVLSAGALSTRAFGLERALFEADADIYLAHNSETLLPAYNAARRRAAQLMFDSMEFHSDMGEEQSALEQRMTRELEKAVLLKCRLILASSAQVADALAQEYGIPRPLPLDNVPPIEPELPVKPASGLALYWRNSVVALGHRGLDEVFVALTSLPVDVTLHLQGRMPLDGGARLKSRIAELRLTPRVVFHPPYAPEDAVKEAARHHVGLCLERKGCRNHELTTSNKIFDYHMAGLVVVASDLPGLRGVLERSHGGLLFRPGSPKDLVERISRLRDDANLRQTLARNAREFALCEGNREREREKFVAVFEEICGQQRKNLERPDTADEL